MTTNKNSNTGLMNTHILNQLLPSALNFVLIVSVWKAWITQRSSSKTGFSKSDHCNLRGVEFTEGMASSPSERHTRTIWQHVESLNNNHTISEINEVHLGCISCWRWWKEGGVSESNRDMWREERGGLQLLGKAYLKRWVSGDHWRVRII